MSQELPPPALQGDTKSPELERAKRAGKKSSHLTLADLMVGNVGLAIVLASPIRIGFVGALPVGTQIPAWVVVLIWAVWFGKALLYGVAVAILVRCVRYQRMPFWAEWVVILFCVYSLQSIIPNMDTTLAAFWRASGIYALGYRSWWLAIGLVAGMGTLIGCMGGRKASLPIAGRIAFYSVAAFLWFWGPCTIFRLLRSDVAALFQTRLLVLSHTWHSLLRLVLALPAFLPFVLPAYWALKTDRPEWLPKFLWSEWCGLVVATLALLLGIGVLVMEIAGVIQQII